MKRILIKGSLVLVTFILTIIIASSLVNIDSEDMTTEMGQATYPVVSIEYNGIAINRMYGYINDMNLSYMRSSITPLMPGRKVHILVDTYSSIIDDISFEVRTVDGKRLIEQTKVNDFTSVGRKIQADLVLKDLIEINTEYELIIVLTDDDGNKIKYYTRVINPNEYYIGDKLQFVSDFSSKTFDQVQSQELTQYLEPNSQADNTSLGKVNIHNSFKQITWGDLKPQRVDDPIITIKELAPLTGSFLVDYYISTDVDNEIKFYKVQEFFRIRYGKERIYLLDYERTMDEVFTDAKTSYDANEIILGINSRNVNMVESEDGNNIAFVSGGRLYAFSIPENRIAYLFGYYDIYTDDVRAMNDSFGIKVVKVDDDGNVTFLVYGYMNRGDHEGECGINAYYYDAGVNSIEEIIYIPSNHAPDLLVKEAEQLSYMNSNGRLYLLMGGKLYEIHSDSQKVDVVCEGLKVGNHVISNDNMKIAWQESDNVNDCQKLILMNLETGVKKAITAQNGETLKPIAFIGNDLVYGMAYMEDITRERSGGIMVPMYQVVIENEIEGVLMYYSMDKLYVTGGEVNGNQITLHRVEKRGENYFTEALDDQIMNSIDAEATKNVFNLIDKPPYQKQSVIELIKDVDAASIKHLTPKMVLYEESREIDLREKKEQQMYVVYGKYGAVSQYTDASTAVQEAYDISGIVMDEEGKYIYQKTSRKTRNQIMRILPAQSTSTRSSLAVCLDTMIEYEGVVRNSQYMLNQGDSALDILGSALVDYEILDLSGCSLDMILYYVDKDIPVLAMMDDKSVLIVGFNDTEVALMDPASEEIVKIPQEEADEMFDENGDFFITYLKAVE